MTVDIIGRYDSADDQRKSSFSEDKKRLNKEGLDSCLFRLNEAADEIERLREKIAELPRRGIYRQCTDYAGKGFTVYPREE